MMMEMRTAILAAVVALAILSGLAVAQGGEEYELWGTVDGGGSTSGGEGFSLTGTIGQPDAGEMSGGEFTLAGGFSESRALIPEHGIYLPVVIKRHL